MQWKTGMQKFNSGAVAALLTANALAVAVLIQADDGVPAGLQPPAAAMPDLGSAGVGGGTITLVTASDGRQYLADPTTDAGRAAIEDARRNGATVEEFIVPPAGSSTTGKPGAALPATQNGGLRTLPGNLGNLPLLPAGGIAGLPIGLGAVNGVVDQVQGTVNGTVGTVVGTVNGVIDQVQGTVPTPLDGTLDTVQGTLGGTVGTVQGTVGGVVDTVQGTLGTVTGGLPVGGGLPLPLPLPGATPAPAPAAPLTGGLLGGVTQPLTGLTQPLTGGAPAPSGGSGGGLLGGLGGGLLGG